MSLLAGYAKIHQVTKFLQLIEKRRLLAGCLLLSLAAASSAVTLGPNLRSAVLGQPLDLSMQLMLDAGEDPRQDEIDRARAFANLAPTP